MKKIVLFLATVLLAMSVQAECRITTIRSDRASNLFKKYGGWQFANYDSVCAKLAKARARIYFTGMSTVLVNQSVGWASFSVADIDSNLISYSFGSMNTQVDSYGSQDKADQLMVAAMNAAANDWTALDDALADLEQLRRKAKGSKGI